MAINKVEYGGQVLIDLTADTVSADTLKKDYTAHAANGEVIVGTMEGGSKTLISLIISEPPTKVEYTVNETLDLTGMVIKVLYSTGEQEIITDYTTDPANGAVLSLENKSVTISYNGLTTSQPISVQIKVVPWATGTDKEIADMVAEADAGLIDLHDYWAVGDTRTVTLSAMSATNVGESHAAQTVQLVLMDSTCKGFTFTSGGGTPRFIVGMYDCLNETGYMNSSDTNYGGWSSSARRKWCNNEFYNSIPSTLRSIFKQFTWKQGKGGKATRGLTETQDYFGLPPEKAIIGSVIRSYSDEAALYDNWSWYTDESHRIKTVNASASSWWECSPYAYVNDWYYFCRVGSDGSFRIGIATASSTIGLAPFGCI